MSWFRDIYSIYKHRHTPLNNSVCIAQNKLDEFVITKLDTIWDSIVDYREEIAGVFLYPFKIEPEVYEYNTTLSIGNSDTNIPVYDISYKNLYMSLGEIYIENKFDDFADYNGYTRIKVFLPLVGFVDIDTNECMGKYLQIRLMPDFNSGKGLYILGVTDEFIPYTKYPNPNNESDIRIIATFECDIAVDIPVGSSNAGDIKRNLLLGAVKTAAGFSIASYQNSLAPTTVTQTATTTYNVMGKSTAKGSRGKPIKWGTETTETKRTYNKPVDKSKPVSEVFNGSIDTLNNLHGGAGSDRVNDAGLLRYCTGNVQAVIYRPKFVNMGDYAHLYGRPLGEVLPISILRGYTEINSIHFEGAGFETITKSEIAMLEQIFSDGVYL